MMSAFSASSNAKCSFNEAEIPALRSSSMNEKNTSKSLLIDRLSLWLWKVLSSTVAWLTTR